MHGIHLNSESLPRRLYRYESEKVYHRQKREGNHSLVETIKHNLTGDSVMVNYKMQRGCHYVVSFMS